MNGLIIQITHDESIKSEQNSEGGIIIKILNDLTCKYNISINSRYGVTHVILFMDSKYNLYHWETATTYALRFKEGNVYDIRATSCEGNNRLINVRILSEGVPDEVKSEQPDAYDVLFGNANYTDKNLTND